MLRFEIVIEITIILTKFFLGSWLLVGWVTNICCFLQTKGHAEPSHWLHEISISKTVCHHFWPGLRSGAEIWGHQVTDL
jgi:hypothetical protein